MEESKNDIKEKINDEEKVDDNKDVNVSKDETKTADDNKDVNVSKDETKTADELVENGWEAPDTETTADAGWGETAKTTSEWEPVAETSEWNVDKSKQDTENDALNLNQNNSDREKFASDRKPDYNRREDYPRKRYDRNDGDRYGGYAQDKRYRSEREDGKERYGDEKRGGYQRERDTPYGDRYGRDRSDDRYGRDRIDDRYGRDRIDDRYGRDRRDDRYRSEDRYGRDRYDDRSRTEEGGYGRDRNDTEGYRRLEGRSSYQSRDYSSGPRDSRYPPRERDSNYGRYGGAREGGYERTGRGGYNRNESATYDPMSDSRPRDYESRPKKVIPENVPPSKTLGLFGLSLYATEEDLREFLAEELVDIKDYKLTIITDYETKKSRGFGFVYFQCLEDSIKAKDYLRGKSIKGKEIRVDYSISDALRPNYR